MNEYLGKRTNFEDDPKLDNGKSASASLETPREREDLGGADARKTDIGSITPPPLSESRPEIRTASISSGAAANAAGAGVAVARAPEEERAGLFGSNESNDLRARWDSIQVEFVDEPREAVQEADALVSATIKRLSEIFANERRALEQQWDRSENISTEGFRVALRRYRSFFGRLLSI